MSGPHQEDYIWGSGHDLANKFQIRSVPDPQTASELQPLFQINRAFRKGTYARFKRYRNGIDPVQYIRYRYCHT